MASETPTSSERLQQLRRDIEHWRLTRQKHGPMPGVLWAEASALARSLGLCPVSRALGISYESLQQRVMGGDESKPIGAPASIGSFVELSGAQLVGVAASSRTTIEVADKDGARLMVRLPAGSTLDVVRLVDTFRRRQG